MNKRKILLLAAAASALPLAASAYTHGKPGLWQATVQMKFAKGGPPPMPQLPPDVLARLKQMGREPPNMNGPMTSQFCLTPEQAAKDQPPAPPQRGNCQMTNFSHSGSTFSADMVCSGEMQGKGHMTVSYDGDEHYAGSMHFQGTSGHLGEVDMTNEFSGKWVGADCGSVQPAPGQ